MRYTYILLLTLTFVGCGPFNSIDSFESDGIYGNNERVSNNNNKDNNGLYYKNYFDQKYSEYGFDNQINDSVLTDISNYSSNSNLTYNKSNGSWGDNPTSINIIFRDRYIYDPYINYYPFGYYDYYNSWYSPFHSRNWMIWGYNSWLNPWGPYRYGYRYNYRYWNYWHPYFGSPYYGGDPYYERSNYNSIAYMNGRRNSNSQLDKSNEILSNGRSITNYNIGRNEVKIGNSETKTDKSEIIKNRNINRVYYNSKNGVRNNGQTLTADKRRDYHNRGELNPGGNTRSSDIKNARSNFQQVKYSGKTRSYDRTRSSLNNSSSNLNRGRDYSRSELNRSGGSINSRSSYSSSSSSVRSSSSSVRSSPRPSSDSAGSSPSRSSSGPRGSR